MHSKPCDIDSTGASGVRETMVERLRDRWMKLGNVLLDETKTKSLIFLKNNMKKFSIKSQLKGYRRLHVIQMQFYLSYIKITNALKEVI